MFPSGPGKGTRRDVSFATGKFVIVPAGVTRRIVGLIPPADNQKFPSAPTATGPCGESLKGMVVKLPSALTRASSVLGAVAPAMTHGFPSGPLTSDVIEWLTASSLICPLVVT